MMCHQLLSPVQLIIKYKLKIGIVYGIFVKLYLNIISQFPIFISLTYFHKGMMNTSGTLNI